MPKLSVTVITRNEAADLAARSNRCSRADEVWWSIGSIDGTVAIAKRFTDRVVVRDWDGYAAQKNIAAALARHDWILSLDADERVTARSPTTFGARSPHAGAPRLPDPAGDMAPRPVAALDRLVSRLHSCGSTIDRRPVDGASVHESVIVDGSIGALSGELQHFAYRDIADHLETIDRYTTLAARQMHDSGRRAGLLRIAGHPPLAFLRNYVARGGFRDGTVGFIVSAMNAYYVFLKFAKLWELERGTRLRVVSCSHCTSTRRAAGAAARIRCC